MAGPTIHELYRYMTIPQAAEELGINPSKLRRRIKAGIFPEPTYINPHGIQFFNEKWLAKTRKIINSSFEGSKAGKK
jgi:predicted DNA-binding transcriptional regulator AlpA